MNSQVCADRVLTTRRDIFTSCSCYVYFEINRKPPQTDKYSGHISLFLGVKMGATLALASTLKRMMCLFPCLCRVWLNTLLFAQLPTFPVV